MPSDIKRLLSIAVTAGAIGGGVSYFMFNRRDLVQLFGTSMQHAVADGLLMVFASVVGNSVKVYIAPTVESMLGAAGGDMRNFANAALGPVTAGGIFIGAKMIAGSPNLRSDSKMQDFILGALGEVLGEYVAQNMGWM